MRTKKIHSLVFAAGLAVVMTGITISSCTKDDNTDPIPDAEIPAGTMLSKKLSTVPSIDGNIDAMWANIPILSTSTTVPNLDASFARPGCNVFAGYEGKKNNVKIRSVYDADKIYFLVEWDDPTESKDRNSWYFDAATKRWKQESTHACSNGTAQNPYYEDKFSFMWNINIANTSWDKTSCYTTCHTGLAAPFTDAVKHYTTNPNDKADVWHWKYVRTNEDYQLDDQYWGYADPANPGGNAGRYTDAKTSGGYADNKQTLKLSDDTSISVTVPKYVIPGKSNYYWLSKAEIDGGTAKLVTAVNSNGVLSYNGGTIDPVSDNGYIKGTGAKRMPSIYYQGPFVGGRGDVSAYGRHTGTGWVLEISRKLNTGDDKDVQFDVKNDYVFGIGLFENAGIAHGIKANLKLKFEQ
ncbi:MAG TPA: hypothetical protein DIW47_09250 [Bacteroidetes bacterium]|nr:hypothetical protein [Bacteroidota bacterium]